jgi:hypothetical protein
MPNQPLLPPIHLIQSRRVVIDRDLAQLYGVATKVFNQTIRRHRIRFHDDFAFQLTTE